MPGRQSVSWRLAVAVTAALITLFAFQQWMGTPRREVDLETSFALQTIAWGPTAPARGKADHKVGGPVRD
jgi:hypothetical protein